MAGSMVLVASTAAGSIDNGVGRRVTIDSDNGRRWRWLGRGGGWVEGGWSWRLEVGVVCVPTYGPHSKMCWLYT